MHCGDSGARQAAALPVPFGEMPDIEVSREELKQLKRQAAIRAKEEDFEKNRKEEEERKRKQLQDLKEEYEAQEKKKVDDRLKFLKSAAEKRTLKKEKMKQLSEKRESKIQSRNEVWLQTENEKIKQIKIDLEEENAIVAENLEEARERKREKEQVIRDRKTTELNKREELDISRMEKESERVTQRELRGIYKADVLKTEATEELESFILNPYPVPLKQVLAGKLRPVPTVTELLAAFKDQKEELKELQEQDIPTRALLRNQSLFQYVRDIQLKAESERIKPPEPQMADLGRSRNRGGQSPKSKFRGTGGAMRGTR